MQIKIGESILELKKGDITQETTQAIVNAANRSLLGGGGVDGAIHRAGGPSILEECKKLAGCDTGQAKITTGGKLKADFVIHTVGPIYRGGNKNEAELLASCYQQSLEIARKKQLASLAFPSISTGAYGYPIEEAAQIALTTVINYLKQYPEVKLVKFILFSDDDYSVYEKTLRELAER